MTSQALLNAQRTLDAYRQRDGVAYTPPSAPDGDDWLAALRAAMAGPQAEPVVAEPVVAEPGARPSAMRAEMAHHPDVAMAAMRAGESSHYQLWMVMRLLDKAGTGRVAWDDLRLHLSHLASKHRLYNEFRLRELVAEGNGRYWQAADCSRANIYYASTAALAFELGVAHLEGRFVVMSAEQAKAPAQTFRAWCFAGWLANHTNPISQAVIEAMTGISPRTQRRYARLVGVDVRENVAIGPQWTVAAAQEQAWQRGQVFEFVDFRGQQGPAGRRYCAWHLPNGYTCCVTTVNRSKQRSANRRLNNLVRNGARGNGRASDGHTRLFFENGAQAAQWASRDGHEAYWRWRQARTGTGLWHVRAAVV